MIIVIAIQAGHDGQRVEGLEVLGEGINSVDEVANLLDTERTAIRGRCPYPHTFEAVF